MSSVFNNYRFRIYMGWVIFQQQDSAISLLHFVRRYQTPRKNCSKKIEMQKITIVKHPSLKALYERVMKKENPAFVPSPGPPS